MSQRRCLKGGGREREREVGSKKVGEEEWSRRRKHELELVSVFVSFKCNPI